MNVRDLLAWGRGRLADQPAGQLEAEILICKVLEVSRAWLYANPESCPAAVQSSDYKGLVQRRVQGVPIAYLTGQREFWSLPLKITADVLIPRPETELLVEDGTAGDPGRRGLENRRPGHRQRRDCTGHCH